MEQNSSYMNYYWIIMFFLFMITDFSKNYFGCIKFIKPILLVFILFIIIIFEINKKCTFQTLPILQISNRAIVLLSIYLYSEYTVKCIPMFNFTIGNLFTYPMFGSFLKSLISFLIMYTCNYISNTYNKQNENENKNKNEIQNDEQLVCQIKNTQTNLVYSISIFGVILLNSYIDYI